MALTDNLVSYYKLDEASGNAADSVGSNTLTNNNSMTYGAGKINNGAIASRTGSKYLTITNAAQTGLGITGSFSMSFWVKIASAPPNNDQYMLMGKERNAAGEGIYVLYYAQTSGVLNLRMEIRDNSSYVVKIYNVDLGTSAFKHIVWTFTAGTHLYNLYIDGTHVVTDDAGTIDPTTNNDKFGIGGSPDASGDATNSNGTFDEAGIWSRALTSTEVTSLYNGGAGWQYPFTTPSGPVNLKSWNGLTIR